MPRSYRIVSNEGYAYFVTCTVVEHLPIFLHAAYRQIVLDSLAYLREHKTHATQRVRHHVHALARGPLAAKRRESCRTYCATSSGIPRAPSRAKRNASATANSCRSLPRPRPDNRARPESQYQVWQEGSHPEAIYSDDFARQKIEYIHFNPVKAGLVAKPEDWPHSRRVPIELRQPTYPPTDIMPLW